MKRKKEKLRKLIAKDTKEGIFFKRINQFY